MFHSLSLKDQAFYLTRLIYRDTEIEVFHSNAASLGSELYAQMLAIVDENSKKGQTMSCQNASSTNGGGY